MSEEKTVTITLPLEKAKEIVKADRIVTAVRDWLEADCEQHVPAVAISDLLQDAMEGLNRIRPDFEKAIEQAEPATDAD